MKDEGEIADYFVDLSHLEENGNYLDEAFDVREAVLEGIEAVSGTVYHLRAVDGAEQVRPTSVAHHLYKRDAESLPDRFGSDLNQDTNDKLKMVNAVLEHGVSRSSGVQQVENGARSLYNISNYDEEDRELLVDAADMAEMSIEQARFWGIDEEVDERYQEYDV